MRKLIWGMLAGAVVTGPVSAESPYYFQKERIERAAFLADKLSCEELALGAQPASVVVPQGGTLYAVGAGAFFGGMLRGRQRRQMQETIQRRCMADKGYARIAVDRAVVRETSRLKGDAQIDRMAAMAAAAPIGMVLPQ